MLAGEFIYQLRSTLDHLAFDLVKMNRNGIALSSNWEDDCAFPIWCDPLKLGQKISLPYGAFKKLPGIPIDAHTIIERVQPYYPPGTGSVNTHLRLLNKLSNIDKHRRFALTRTRAKIFHRVIYKSGFRGESLDTLDHGAEIPKPYAGEDDPIVDMKRSTTLTIAFDERDAPWRCFGRTNRRSLGRYPWRYLERCLQPSPKVSELNAHPPFRRRRVTGWPIQAFLWLEWGSSRNLVKPPKPKKSSNPHIPKRKRQGHLGIVFPYKLLNWILERKKPSLSGGLLCFMDEVQPRRSVHHLESVTTNKKTNLGKNIPGGGHPCTGVQDRTAKPNRNVDDSPGRSLAISPLECPTPPFE